MRIPSAVLVAAAVILALPFGWGVGVIVAYMIAGKDFGQLPAGTVPIAIVASITFALSASISPKTRFAVTASGTLLFILLSLIT